MSAGVASRPVPSRSSMQALALQQAQRAAGIGGVGGDADLGAVGEVRDRVVAARIEADRPDGGDGDRHDAVAVGGDLAVEEGLVLEGIGFDLALVERRVRSV